MASQQQAAAKKPEPPQADEQQLQEAFDHLNELHAQLRALRSAIPHMIAPLTAKQPSRMSTSLSGVPGRFSLSV